MRIYRIACLDESVPGVRRGAAENRHPGSLTGILPTPAVA